MKISKKIEPMVAGMWVALIIGSLSLLTYETSTGIWLMISFGPSASIAIVLFKSEIAQPSNIIFGHLICIIIGILFNEIFGVSFLTLGLAVGVSVTLMMYLKSVHPPAAANPLIALLSDVSFEYILFPEAFSNKIGGDIQKSPKPIPFEIVRQNDTTLTFISPNKKGAYRIFAHIKNEKGQSSVANIPFLVE